MARIRFLTLALVVMAALVLSSSTGQAQEGTYRSTFVADGLYLRVEVLDDDLAHFELSAVPPAEAPIWTSPMVARTDYAGPSSLEFPTADEIATPEMRLRVDPASLCVTVTDRARDTELVLTTICPLLDDDAINGLTLTEEGATDIYGLGEQFRRRGGTDGDWMGERRLMPNQYGNGL